MPGPQLLWLHFPGKGLRWSVQSDDVFPGQPPCLCFLQPRRSSWPGLLSWFFLPGWPRVRQQNQGAWLLTFGSSQQQANLISVWRPHQAASFLAIFQKDKSRPELDPEGTAQSFPFPVIYFYMENIWMPGQHFLYCGLCRLTEPAPWSSKFKDNVTSSFFPSLRAFFNKGRKGGRASQLFSKFIFVFSGALDLQLLLKSRNSPIANICDIFTL